MEHRENNIFYNVIKNETSLTEVFCNLMQYKAFRDLFLKIINSKLKDPPLDLEKIVFNSFETEKDFIIEQKNSEDIKCGRGDLVLDAADAEFIFELKIELYTDLTINQPEGYLQYLNSKNFADKNLFFILPRGYLHLGNIYKRWNKKTAYSPKSINSNNIIYWDEILDAIRRSELDKINLFIGEFCDILDYRWFKYDDIIFTLQELKLIFNKNKKIDKGFTMLDDTNLPSAIGKLYNIIENAQEKLYIVSSYDRQNPEYYGYILNNKKYKIPDKWDIWFGVDYEVWGKDNLPISIQISTDKKDDMDELKDLLKSYDSIYEELEDAIQANIFLDKEIFKNEEKNIAKELVVKICKIINTISSYKCAKKELS